MTDKTCVLCVGAQKAGATWLCLDSSWLRRPTRNYVEAIAKQRQISSETLLSSAAIRLVKYEDFVQDNGAYIMQLGKDLCLGSGTTRKVEYSKQFQPKGSSVDDRVEYFGSNLARINSICSQSMAKFGYQEH